MAGLPRALSGTRGPRSAQQQLAEEVGIGRVTIARIEAGTAPSVTIALKIARATGESVEALFAGGAR